MNNHKLAQLSFAKKKANLSAIWLPNYNYANLCALPKKITLVLKDIILQHLFSLFARQFSCM